jgi:Ca2+-binding RTX toxin-like protein
MADIDGTTGPDSLIGTDEDDFFFLSTGNDTLDGRGGSDWLLADADFIEVDLGAGTAVFDGFTQVLRNIENIESTGDNARLTGSDGANQIFVIGSNSTVYGGAGDDFLDTETGGAVMDGGAGNDTLAVYGYGATTVAGGTGNDMLENWQGLSDFTVAHIAGGLRLTSRSQVIDVMDDVETFTFDIRTYSYAEVLARAPNQITGTAGNDTLYGTAGNDRIGALAGNDWILPGGVGRDTVDGGDGRDMLSFAGLGSGITLRLPGARPDVTTAQGTTEVSNIEAFTGTSQRDMFWGSAGDDHFRGLGGADRFHGDDGADYFDGGAGSDWLYFDRLSATDPGVYVSLLRGRGWTGEATGDRFTNVENIGAGAGNDRLDGDHGANHLSGGYGDDTLTGLGGDDTLYGGHGTDVAVYFGNQADYAVVTNGFRTDVTHLNNGWEGHDLLAHVEILRFADGDLIL